MAKRSPGQTDYRDLSKAGERKELPGQTSRRWWAMKDRDVADGICSTVDFLQKAQRPRIQRSIGNYRWYGGVTPTGTWAAITRQLQSQSRDRLTFNAIQSIVDTLVSRVGETKPRPYFLTSGGNYKQQRKAKKLNQYVEGVFYETKTYDVGLKAFRDAAIDGDGLVHVYPRAGKIHHERVMATELWVDEVEAQYGFPRNMYRDKLVDRDELAGWFPDKADLIMKASAAPMSQRNYGRDLSDMVQVIEAWHLGVPDENDEVKGGLHAIALSGGSSTDMLVEPEDWPYDFFPFARIPWCERPLGYWSQGLCEQLAGEQSELNKELFLIQRSMQLAGTVKVFLQAGSKVSKEQINNEIGGIINYTGQPPQYYCPEPIHPVYFENVNRIIERMYRKAGVSEMSASAKKPAGLNSGRALREAEDIESDRHKSISRQNDNLYLAIAALDVCFAKELGGHKVRVPGKSSFESVDFKDIGNIKDTEFIMQCFPVSRLPRDPAGRLQTVQEYVQAGFITPRQARKALDFADLDSIESLANAQEDMLTKVLDAIVDDGEYQPPEPTDDLSLAKEMVVEYIQRFRALDLEQEKLELLRNWSSQVDMMSQQAQAAVAPPPMTPQAAAAPPPVSDMVPNVPPT